MKTKTINLTIAENWNQLTPKQVLFVCRIFMADIPEESARIRLFMHLTGIKPVWHRVVRSRFRFLLKRGEDIRLYFFRKGRKQFRLSPSELHHFLKKTDFIFNGCYLTQNKFLRIGKLYGPVRHCYNIKLREFIHCERHRFQFDKDKNDESLNKLCAILYRPAGDLKNPVDVRVSFNEYTYAKRAKKLKGFTPYHKLAVYLFYSASISAMVKKYSNLFSKTASSSEPKNPVPGLLDSVKLLTGFDVSKDEEILDKQVWQAFDYLDTIIKNAPKNKK